MAIVDLVMPKMGESIMEATILKWHKQPGDPVKMDETVLEIATNNANPTNITNPTNTTNTTYTTVPSSNGNRFYSPLVLNIAAQEGVSLSELENIPGTGNEGRVTKKDILQYVSDQRSGKIRQH